MKKIIAFLIACTSILSTIAYAEGEINVSLNGEVLEFDVPAQAINQRTMVPMRAIFEKMGADVEWIPEDQMIFATKGSKLICMKLDSDVMLVVDMETNQNDKITLDAPPQAINNRTLVPVRAISESLGLTVTWEQETSTVLING